MGNLINLVFSVIVKNVIGHAGNFTTGAKLLRFSTSKQDLNRAADVDYSFLSTQDYGTHVVSLSAWKGMRCNLLYRILLWTLTRYRVQRLLCAVKKRFSHVTKLETEV